MQTFILRRLLIGVVILFILSVTVFTLLRVAPGDPAIRICGLNCTTDQINEIHERLGLNKPRFPISVDVTSPKFVSINTDSQYGNYMKGVLTGDLGTSSVNQKPVGQQIIPVPPVEAGAAPATLAAVEYEPDQEEILADLLPRNVAVQIFRALLENAASEQGSRMTAMDNATRNAGDMINRLTIEYNRTRQAAITKELIEIISGAEAL